MKFESLFLAAALTLQSSCVEVRKDSPSQNLPPAVPEAEAPPPSPETLDEVPLPPVKPPAVPPNTDGKSGGSVVEASSPKEPVFLSQEEVKNRVKLQVRPGKIGGYEVSIELIPEIKALTVLNRSGSTAVPFVNAGDMKPPKTYQREAQQNPTLLLGAFAHNTVVEVQLYQDLKNVTVVEKVLPRDFIHLAGDAELPAMSRKYGRIYLGRNTKLFTDKDWVLLEADEIISENAQIVAAPLGAASKAKVNESGKRGAFIELRAQKITGQLHVEIRSQDGGDGLPAEPWLHDAVGFESLESVLAGNNFQYIAPLKGKTGQPGHEGKPGQNGGDGGTLKIMAGDMKNLMLTHSIIPGLKGNGGIGSPGQMGSFGRMGNQNYPAVNFGKIKILPRFERIPSLGRGDQGPRGKDGSPGEDGKAGVVCYADPKTGSCN